MPSILTFRRGTAAQNDAFTGSAGEITVDSTNGTLRVHDGVTAGGSQLATQSYVTTQLGTLGALASQDTITESQISDFGTYLTPTGDGSQLTGISSYADSDALSLFNVSGSAPVYANRAWVYMNGGQGNSVGINASGNVSSVSRNGTGEYGVSFITAMPNSNYVVSGVVNYAQTTNAHYISIGDNNGNNLPSSSGFGFGTPHGTTRQDCEYIRVGVFGG